MVVPANVPESLCSTCRERLARTDAQSTVADPSTQTASALSSSTNDHTPASTFQPFNSSTGTERIGHYKLLQKIGEGGFGVGYLAEQEQPVRRRVALKVIKLGMDTRQVVARFEAERQALALMDHPNIAKFFQIAYPAW